MFLHFKDAFSSSSVEYIFLETNLNWLILRKFNDFVEYFLEMHKAIGISNEMEIEGIVGSIPDIVPFTIPQWFPQIKQQMCQMSNMNFLTSCFLGVLRPHSPESIDILNVRLYYIVLWIIEFYGIGISYYFRIVPLEPIQISWAQWTPGWMWMYSSTGWRLSRNGHIELDHPYT